MSNISTKLNLAALIHKRGTVANEDCIIIPIAKNNLYKGEKGLYLNLTHIEVKNPATDQKDTHLVKQDLPKEIYNNLSDDAKKAMPILGNSILWGSFRNEPALAQAQSTDDIILQDPDLPF